MCADICLLLECHGVFDHISSVSCFLSELLWLVPINIRVTCVSAGLHWRGVAHSHNCIVGRQLRCYSSSCCYGCGEGMVAVHVAGTNKALAAGTALSSSNLAAAN